MIKEKQIKTEEPKGMVEIPQSQLDTLIKRLDSLEKDKDMLLQIADKKQLGIYYQRHQGKIPTRVMLRTMMTGDPLTEKVIIGWRSTKDIPPQIDPATGKWTAEDQRCELLFEDGTSSGEIYQAQFARHYKQVEAEVKSKIQDEVTGNLALKVMRLDNMKEYVIGVAFVN